MRHLLLAFQCFFWLLFRHRLPAQALALLPRPAAPPTLPPREAEIVATHADRSVVNGADVRVVSGKPLPPSVATGQDNDTNNETSHGAIQLLALLQREGRLLDFLQEEIDGYDDAQVGAAVRDIHRGCRKALAEHLPVEPVLRQPDNATVRIDAGFDPSSIRLVGNVVGEPPFTGTLRHHGWRTGKVTLPDSSRSTDRSVVAPAEVELS